MKDNGKGLSPLPAAQQPLSCLPRRLLCLEQQRSGPVAYSALGPETCTLLGFSDSPEVAAG